jgi:hypothetical protein
MNKMWLTRGMVSYASVFGCGRTIRSETSVARDPVGLVYACGCLSEFAINYCFGEIVKCVDFPRY